MTAKTVLIVEDNQLNMKLFNDILQYHGYRIVQSFDGHNLLQMVREHCPDLVIMDIQLPASSGIELASLIRADPHFKHLPIVAVTAFTDLGVKERILQAGCDDYFAKPISVPVFLETVARHLS